MYLQFEHGDISLLCQFTRQKYHCDYPPGNDHISHICIIYNIYIYMNCSLCMGFFIWDDITAGGRHHKPYHSFTKPPGCWQKTTPHDDSTRKEVAFCEGFLCFYAYHEINSDLDEKIYLCSLQFTEVFNPMSFHQMYGTFQDSRDLRHVNKNNSSAKR